MNKLREQGDSGYFIPEFSSTEELGRDYIESQSLYYYRIQVALLLKTIFFPADDSFTTTGGLIIPEIDEIAGVMANDAGESAFRCYQSYGVNSNSKNKKLAWEFIKFLLGEDMQLSLNLLGFPVNNAAFIEKSKVDMIKMPNYGANGTISGYHELTDQKYRDAYENYMACLNGIADALSFYPIEDKILNDMVQKETALFFDGSKTADEVADVLQNRVQLYLDE